MISIAPGAAWDKHTFFLSGFPRIRRVPSWNRSYVWIRIESWEAGGDSVPVLESCSYAQDVSAPFFKAGHRIELMVRVIIR